MQKNFKKYILQTLAYFDIFDHPLTQEELFRYLYVAEVNLQLNYTDFLLALNKLVETTDLLEQNQGFYFLSGRKNIIQTRQSRVKLVEEKMKIAVRGIKKISQVPFVKAVFVCNTLGYGIVEEDSDIDVFIVIKKGRLFITRALVTLYLSFLRMRRTKKKIKNKICLSFYIADDSLNLEKTAIKNDIYLIYWLSTLVPVYDPQNFYQIIIKNNQWLNKYLLNELNNYVPNNLWKVAESKKVIKNFFEKVWSGGYGEIIEKQAKEMQLAKMKMNLHSLQNEADTRVVISDEMLKFHENDRREEYRDKWLEKCNKIFNSINF
ncbi:MAG: hypothetical protein ACOXZY_03720 [Patescibacteria group bacterium]|jgi:hypothetical protein|nr:hypothetical protein [Candidatus Magasanikbacteria bacterium]HQL52948.1 hypothetical protein [Candidatus Magasanikbacteria bacterium]